MLVSLNVQKLTELTSLRHGSELKQVKRAWQKTYNKIKDMAASDQD